MPVVRLDVNGRVLVTGMPGSGKATVARLLAQHFPLAAHIDGRGVWIDTSDLSPAETVERICRHLGEAVLA